MRRFKRVLAAVIVGFLTLVSAMVPSPVLADCDPKSNPDCVETSILPGDLDIDGLLRLILSILIYGLGAAAILGVIVVGIQYMTARDNEQQATKAKKRLYEIMIGLVAWAVMFAVLNWLIPGGLKF